jgi:hypothetical protein
MSLLEELSGSLVFLALTEQAALFRAMQHAPSARATRPSRGLGEVSEFSPVCALRGKADCWSSARWRAQPCCGSL